MFDGCIHQFLILKNKWLSDKSSQFLIQSQIDWLVVLSHPSEKYEYEFVNVFLGWHPIYEMENNPVLFETTNQ
jgi:proteasome lid subunit RPN8/RPN11